MSQRVVIVQRYLAHFRSDFFRRLAEDNPDLRIEVFHGGAQDGGTPTALEGVRARRFRTFELGTWLGFDLVLQPGLVAALLWSQPDLVVLEGTFGVLTNAIAVWARRLRRLPTLYWVCGWEKPQMRGWRHGVKRAVVRSLLRLSSGAIAYGSAARAYLLDYGVPAERITVAQNTIDVEAILDTIDVWKQRGRELRRSLAPRAKRVVVYVGRLTPAKRVALLLDAYAELRAEWQDLALVVVGEGPCSAHLRSQIEALRIPDVHFAGEVREGVEAYLAAGDLFVLPGIGGLALNQAMALGLPLVATAADGTECDLIVPGENGYLARVDDAEDLREHMRRVLENPSRARRMGERSIEILRERATLTRMVGSFSCALHRACGIRAPAGASVRAPT